jgi:hypothetical protein
MGAATAGNLQSVARERDHESSTHTNTLRRRADLLPLGIEKGKEFKPDAATLAQLKSAAAEAHAWLLAKLPTFVEDWWPGSQWKVPVSKIAVETGFKWTVANYFDVDSRGIGFSSFFVPPAKLGAGSARSECGSGWGSSCRCCRWTPNMYKACAGSRRRYHDNAADSTSS